MGLNSPIELKMTEAGLAAKENAESIIFTRFLAGSTGDTGSTSVTSIKQVIPINNYVKRIAGQEYIQDGVTQVANESFLSISGFANSLDAENEYVLNEIALMAKLDENGEEFCFAYDWSNSYKYRIRTDLSQPITVQYKIVLTRVPQLTINTSETGVTFSDLYAHTEKTVTQTPVHGLKCVDGVLTVNNQALHKSTVGLGNVDNTSDLDKPISTAVQTALDNLEDRIDAIDGTGSSITLASLGGASATDLTNHTSDTSNPHSVTYSQTGAAAASHTHTESDITDLGSYANASHTHTESDITDLGSYASNTDLNTYGVSDVSFDNSTSVLTVTMKGGSTKTVTITSATSGSGSGSSGSSLSISSVLYDDTTNNIVFTMSDNSEITCNLDDLLAQGVQFNGIASTGLSYNSEWEDRLTGSGTALDPYLIYTPKDFTKIQDHMDAHYKLMNNLDFSELTGLSIEINGNSFTIITEDNTAPLYNNGEGYRPFGYNGYMPKSDSEVNTTITTDTYGTFSMVYGDITTYPSNAFHIFTGELDGNSKVIKGIICSPAHTYSVGLFSFIGNGASVHNLTIKDSTFICNEVYINNFSYKSSVASVAGSITYLSYTNDPISISNVYNYATLISNRSTESGSQAKIAGICGCIDPTEVPGISITACSNRGQMIIVDSAQKHRVAGIYYNDYDTNSPITNCINSANIIGYKAYGIGLKMGKVNINCGEMATQDSNTTELYPITDQTTATYVDGSQYANIAIQSITTSSFATDNTNNVKYKSISDLKSQQFITDANTANGTDVFKYNDLNFDDGWPLLADEYDIVAASTGITTYLALIDPSSNKIYNSEILIDNLVTQTGLNTYGVDSMSFNTSTNVLTLTMKGGSTKTVTIPASSGGNGNSSSSVSTITYDDTNERLVFTMSDTSVINCDISSLISALNITYDPLDSRTYNSEWEDRITGAGTELDPYLIYTPKDFMKINDDMTAHYKLMNNLDFAPVIGMNIEINGEGYEITTTDNSASLYHNGEGFWPIGYDGYFPLNGETKSTKTFAEANWGGEIVYGTNNAALAYIFTGELDGNSKFIKGIVSSPINTYSVALFSFLGNGASVHNLTIKDSVFIVNDVYATGDKKSSVASIAGNLIYTNRTRNPVNIYNIYNYATIISNRSTSNGDDYAQINGIFGRLNGDENPGYIVRECANHGELIIVNDSVHHGCSGIGYYKFYNNSDNRIINCINTANLYGYKIWGIGQNIGKVNINCGNMSKSNQLGIIYPITDHLNNSYIDGKQFANNTIQSIADPVYRNDGTYNIYYKSTAELKSQDFIDEANALLPEPVFIYNDLNVNDGWPLLIDEYNTLIGVNGNLNLSLIDPINNKLYKSGYSLEKLQKVVTYREMNSEINGQFDQYVSNQLGGLKTISLTIATSNWTAEEENGTPTGNYLATVSVNGITSTSPVQLMTQLTDIEIKISQIASNSVTLIANSLPNSDLKISIMFTT